MFDLIDWQRHSVRMILKTLLRCWEKSKEVFKKAIILNKLIVDCLFGNIQSDISAWIPDVNFMHYSRGTIYFLFWKVSFEFINETITKKAIVPAPTPKSYQFAPLPGSSLKTWKYRHALWKSASQTGLNKIQYLFEQCIDWFDKIALHFYPEQFVHLA